MVWHHPHMRFVVLLCLISCVGSSASPVSKGKATTIVPRSFTAENWGILFALTVNVWNSSNQITIDVDQAKDAMMRVESISYMDGYFKCNGLESAEGCTSYKDHPGKKPVYKIYVTLAPCLAISSAAHELLHVIHYEVYGNLGDDHSAQIFARNPRDPSANPDALQWQIIGAAIQHGLCPELEPGVEL